MQIRRFEGALLRRPGFRGGVVQGPLSFGEFVTWPHRGGSSTQPENSVQAAAALRTENYGFVDGDVYVLADGTAVVMHDTTIDRTSSGTGTVASFLTAASWAAQTLDAPTFLAATGYANEALPTLASVLTAYPGAFWSLEAKNTNADIAIVNALIAAGVPAGRAIVWSTALPTTALAAGYEIGFVGSDISATDFATLRTQGFRHVCFGTVAGGTAAAIASAHDNGLKVYQYTLTRRTELSAAVARGVDGIFADEPQYLRTPSALATASTWHTTNKWMPGMLPNNSVRGAIASNRWSPGVIGDIVQSHTGALMGWACPLANAAGSYTITFDFNFSAVANIGRWGIITLCRTTDASYSNGVADTDPCYEILWRQSGSLELYRRDSGGASALIMASAAPSTFTLGVTYTLVAFVTPTTITLTRADNGHFTTYAHSTYRGGYFHLGRQGAAMTIGSVVVT